MLWHKVGEKLSDPRWGANGNLAKTKAAERVNCKKKIV